MSQRGLSRRRFLEHLGVVGLGVAGLSACNVSTDTGNDDDNADSPEFNFDDIPDSGAEIPDGDITFSWMDSGDLKALFQEPFFKAYQEKYPNIQIDYQPSPAATIDEAIPVAIRNNTAPDVFANITVAPTQTMINEGWVQPLDDVVPNFDEWKAGFPEGIFIEGTHVFDGKTYTFPISSDKRYSYLLFFHPPYIDEAGYDPVNERMTWSTFREACKAITQQGKGEYYGLITASNQLGPLALELAKLSGLEIVGTGDGPLGALNPRTGEIVVDAPEIAEAFELLLAIRDDKSLFPGFMGLDHATARSRYPQKIAGFIFDGPWDLPVWPKDFPDFEFDIAMPPTGDDGEPHPAPYYQNGANFPFVSAGTKNDAIVGDIFSYFGTVEAQANVVVFSEGNLTSMIPEANDLARESNELDPNAVKGIEFAQELMRVAADVRVRNPEVVQAILKLKPVSPNLQEIGQSVFADNKDPQTELKKYKDALDKALDDAIAAASAEGANVSRDDFVFPNWDPTTDYTPEMYAEL